jgi:O-antigen/teichoic acid export membrane protein
MELASAVRRGSCVSELFLFRGLSLGERLRELRQPLFRNAYALALNDAGNAALGYVYWLLAARLFSPEQVGIGSALISAQQLLSGIAALRLSGALLRFLPRAGRATGRLIGVSYAINLAGGLLAGAVFVAGLQWWAPSLGFVRDSGGLAVWFVLAVMMWCIFALQDVVLTSFRQTLVVPIENGLFGIAKIGLLLAALPLGNFGIFASWTVPVALSLLPINWLIACRFGPRHARDTAERAIPFTLRDVLSHTWREYVSYIFTLVANTVLPLMVVERVGASANAYFYIAWLISTALHLLAINMVQSLTVEVAFDQEQLASHLRSILLHILRLLLPAVLIVAAGAPLLLALFGQNYAAGGATTLRLLALASIPHVLNAAYTGVARAQGRLNGVVALNVLLAAAVLGFSYLFLPRFGIETIGVVWLAAQTAIAAILAVWWLRPLLGVPHDLGTNGSPRPEIC